MSNKIKALKEGDGKRTSTIMEIDGKKYINNIELFEIDSDWHAAKPSEKIAIRSDVLLDRTWFEHGEQYFLVLLHEIYHFKIDESNTKVSIPMWYLRLKEKMKHDGIDDLESQFDSVWNYVEQRDNESDEKFLGRVEGFRQWILGEGPTVHKAVEDHARKEFVKRREEIINLL